MAGEVVGAELEQRLAERRVSEQRHVAGIGGGFAPGRTELDAVDGLVGGDEDVGGVGAQRPVLAGRDVAEAAGLAVGDVVLVRPGERVGADGEVLEGDGFRLPVPQSLRAVTAGKGGKKLKVGIRPDNVIASGASVRGESAPIEVNVDLVEPLGNEVIVHSRLADNSLVFRLPPQHSPESGAKVQVQVELDALHLFDAETEQRLSA
mgnify:CR=1 FL=1